MNLHFNPRAPCGARPFYGRRRFIVYDISTHAPLAGRDAYRPKYEASYRISTHAPLAGRDLLLGAGFLRIVLNFNPRTPCGARLLLLLSLHRTSQFQPTRPLRGATITWMGQLLDFYISTHAPLAGRDSHLAPVSLERKISTHAPLAGRDGNRRGNSPAHFYDFNPRAPCGARQPSYQTKAEAGKISTHAPLAGRDASKSRPQGRRRTISTHAPLAGRDQASS